ncbi:hypothetical protein BDZ89DRAFT_1063497 [Hymenopellis radicata]|nr:hypothetical protein BDZ89DRAFT_1086012 [Hymenopellis radicata]KAF9001415.1 hypothetical protein BDZ89DRAFT_1081835 [Hymenopellis radicata]KAF9018808.1 hypothetical protein BDZ89DRAFT_1073562 [Hymenopellis radicata]KAF9032115.1 hypothetical protein BDZ89DRAFT_1063497 [Hymenopellis radicata]
MPEPGELRLPVQGRQRHCAPRKEQLVDDDVDHGKLWTKHYGRRRVTVISSYQHRPSQASFTVPRPTTPNHAHVGHFLSFL